MRSGDQDSITICRSELLFRKVFYNASLAPYKITYLQAKQNHIYSERLMMILSKVIFIKNLNTIDPLVVATTVGLISPTAVLIGIIVFCKKR